MIRKEKNIKKEEQTAELKMAMKVSAVSIFVNVLLSLFKLFAGIIAHSGAMVSDAIHSASDVFSTIVVMIGVHLSGQKSDKEHPYGHERMECVAAILLAVILAATGIGIGWSAVKSIATHSIKAGTAQAQNVQAHSVQAHSVLIPGVLALAAAIISIITKEAMYWYTRYYAKKADSSAMMADAWHHRSDAMSSIGALVGIAASRMGYPIMDSVASLVICIFIEKAAFDIFKDAVDKMVDKACDEETQKAICDCVQKQPGVERIDMLRTRVFGNKIYVDIEIGVDGEKTLTKAHEVAQNVHDSIEKVFPKVKHIMVHVNPV